MLGAVAHGASVVAVTLDVALGALALGSAGDVQSCAFLEVCDGDDLSDFIGFAFFGAELRQDFLGADASLFEVTSHGLGDSVCFLIFKSDLNSFVAVVLHGLDLGDCLRTRFDDGYGDDVAFFGEDLRHADFSSE